MRLLAVTTFAPEAREQRDVNKKTVQEDRERLKQIQMIAESQE